MKKNIVSAILIAASFMIAGCARHEVTGTNDANVRYFNAWMKANGYTEGSKFTDLGAYIIDSDEGTGTEIKEGGYVLMDYVITDLEGNITSHTTEETARQLGTYEEGNYYGPKFQSTHKGSIPAGLADVFKGMKVGGRKKVIIPTWLMTYSSYDTKEEYLDEKSSTASAIYDFTIRDFTEDINEWQIEKIGDYFAENAEIFGDMTVADSLKAHKGFYYKQLTAPEDTTAFNKDTTIYINYTGRLLDGSVFDTTNERIAKDNGIWSSTKTYEPVSIKWGEEYSDISMGSGSVISGFGLTLWQMRKFEKGIGVFTSEYGYGYSGSGQSIPGFAPLTFEIEIVPKPED